MTRFASFLSSLFIAERDTSPCFSFSDLNVRFVWTWFLYFLHVYVCCSGLTQDLVSLCVVQVTATLCAIGGIATAVYDRSARRSDGELVYHLTSAHSWLGVIVVVLLSCQALAGSMMYWVWPRRRPSHRHLHRYIGFLTHFSAVLAVLTGLSQYGHYIALQVDGECLEPSFDSTTCFERRFAILTCLVWAIGVTALGPKLSEGTRRKLLLLARRQSGVG